MKFNAFKEFRHITSITLDSVIAYLRNDMSDSMRQLQVGLSRLSLLENFVSFEVVVKDLVAGSEIRIRNELREGQSSIIPKYYIVVRRQEGAEYIIDGGIPWDENYVYLKNNHPTPGTTATFTVIFFA
jgi:hypothetical protein